MAINLSGNASTKGMIGQEKGPFTSNDSIIFKKKIKLGVIIGEKDYMKYSPFQIKIQLDSSNESIIQIGQKGIYELYEIYVDTISFPAGAPDSVIIDYVILE